MDTAITEVHEENESPFAIVTHPIRRAFLAAYAECGGNITEAALIVGMSRNAYYSKSWLNDTDFQACLPLAHRMALDAMEDEARRRAITGWEEPTGWYKGVAGGTIRRFSDTLMQTLLKGNIPEKYRDSIDIRGMLANLDVNKLPDSIVARFANGEHPVAVLLSALESKLVTRGEVEVALGRPNNEILQEMEKLDDELTEGEDDPDDDGDD